MGVVLKNREPSFRTSDLSDWINRVRVKKLNFKRQKRKNLFIEAVLANALSRAETELKSIQRERKRRWQRLKSTYLLSQFNNSKDYDEGGCPGWSPGSCEDLNSFDDFMSQLKEVKVLLAR